MKKNTVKGFGAHYIDENLDEEKMPKEIGVEESLVAMIFDSYEPVDSLPESTDQKTTIVFLAWGLFSRPSSRRPIMASANEMAAR